MSGTGYEHLPVTGVRERTQAMASYARAFFRSMSSEEFAQAIEDARSFGQQRLVERLYAKKVIDNIVKAILARIDRGDFVGDQLNDYIHDAVVVLMQIARQEKFDLTKSAGEIASYVCLWIEQRVKRAARKDQRWRFSLSETPVDLEESTDNTDFDETRQPKLNARLSQDGCASDRTVEGNFTDVRTPRPAQRHNPVVAHGLRKSDRHVLPSSAPQDRRVRDLSRRRHEDGRQEIEDKRSPGYGHACLLCRFLYGEAWAVHQFGVLHPSFELCASKKEKEGVCEKRGAVSQPDCRCGRYLEKKDHRCTQGTEEVLDNRTAYGKGKGEQEPVLFSSRGEMVPARR